MEIVDLSLQPDSIRNAATECLVSEFDAPSGWQDRASADAEVERILREGFARAVVDGGHLVGWVGALPEYSGRVWELHPIVVRRAYRRRGIGRLLVGALEEEVRRRGGLTITLGTDDDRGMTSVTGVDLYADVPRHIRELRDLGGGHPFLFYRQLGFVITGVMPDANGPGKPDIYMSRPVRQQNASSRSRQGRAT